MKFKLSTFLPLLGVALFLAVLYFANPAAIFATLAGANASLVLLAFAVNFSALFFKSWRWQRICRFIGFQVPFLDATRYWLASFSFGAVTPGRIGDLSRAFYLKRPKNVPFSRSLITVFVDRLFDVFTLVLLGAFGIFSLASSSIFGSQTVYNIALFLGAFVALLLLLTKKNAMLLVLRPVFSFFVPDAYKERVRVNFNDFYELLPSLRKQKLLLLTSLLLSVIPWFVSIYSYQVLAQALGLNLGIGYLLQVIPIIFLLELVPVSFSGLGTRDAALVVFFSFIGLTATQAVSFSIAMLSLHVLNVLLGALLFYREHPDVSVLWKK